MSQVQQTPNIYKPGVKQHVSFTSLKELEKYEPNVFKLLRLRTASESKWQSIAID
jgi:hypothetical protein